MLGRAGRIKAGVNNGDGKAFGTEDVSKLKHGANMALQRQGEENHSAALPVFRGSVVSWVLHGACFLRFASQCPPYIVRDPLGSNCVL